MRLIDMRIRAPALILFALAACGPSRDDPVSSAKAFVKLARGVKCKETWPFYTKASQQVLEARSKKDTKMSPAYAEMFAPGNLECTGRFAHYLPRTVREVSRRGDTATLAAIMRTGTLFALIPFMSSPRKDSPAEMTMVLEDGVWKVSIPPPPENPHRHLVEFGKYTVDWPRNRPTSRGGFQVDGVMDATPEDVEAVVLDFENWPKWVPFLVESRVLSQHDSKRIQRIYGRYQFPGDSASADYVLKLHNSLRTTDRDFKGFGAAWMIAKDDTLPVRRDVTRLTSLSAEFSFRVEQRVTGPIGVSVRYSYSGLPGEWPPALAAKIFAPEMAAEIMASLEREAQRRAKN
ncbi:MAG: SRPBCC family protein [Gemmatimonadaceae bacterium]